MCSSLMPRLRAASSVRSSSAVPTPLTLPVLLDRERGLRLVGEALAERTQFRDATQHAVDEEAMDHGIEAERQRDVILDELIRHRAAEAVAAALLIETQQMVAIRTGAVDPQFADHAAVDQMVVHQTGS